MTGLFTPIACGLLDGGHVEYVDEMVDVLKNIADMLSKVGIKSHGGIKFSYQTIQYRAIYDYTTSFYPSKFHWHHL